MLKIQAAILSTTHAFAIQLDDSFLPQGLGPIFSDEDAACIGPECPGVIRPPFEDDCYKTLEGLQNEFYTFDATDREVLDELYDQILEAWNDSLWEDEFVDWGMNFRYDRKRPFITQHFEPTQQLVEKFALGFENTGNLEHALNDLFWARTENNLEAYIMVDERPQPDTSICNLWQAQEISGLVERINYYGGQQIDRRNKEKFLKQVLEWLLTERVDVTPVTQNVRRLKEKLLEFSNEDLQDNKLLEELNELYQTFVAKDIELPGCIVDIRGGFLDWLGL